MQHMQSLLWARANMKTDILHRCTYSVGNKQIDIHIVDRTHANEYVNSLTIQICDSGHIFFVSLRISICLFVICLLLNATFDCI